MALAIFDLDDTLIAGDSASLWLRFLVDQGLAAPEMLSREQEMMQAYRQGALRMEDYMRFTLRPLAGKPLAVVADWAADFIESVILPIIYPAARQTIAGYQAEGRRCLVISATGEHLVKPIAARLGIHEQLSIQLELDKGRYSGETTGTLTYQIGKVTRLHEWLGQTGETLSGSHGYSDSVNDIPLLETVEKAFTVNPDPKLADHAFGQNWERLTWQL